MKRKIIFLLSILFTLWLYAGEPAKVACVGNSVTYGAGIDDRTQTYPAQLQKMLGKGYEVGNFGHSGATLLKNGHRPYWNMPEFREALAFNPDIVIIHLGLNDTDPRNWPKFSDQFTKDYIDLIHAFQQTKPGIRIWICRMTPIFTGHPRFKSSTREWYNQIQHHIERVADVTNVGLIDLNSPLHNRPDLFPDQLHPTAEGASIIAKSAYGAITGNFGGLQLPAIFSDRMVIQQGKPITFWGRANAGTTVTVHFAGKTRYTKTTPDGKWNIQFPAMKAGGPYKATIENEKNAVCFSDILVGEVWICSGQSNMAFQLKSTLTGKEELPHTQNPGLRFFDIKEIAATASVEWNDTVLAAVNRLQYFKPTVWRESDPATAAQFSAVAYYFGKILQEKLDVPVGLILNAIGGSPTEAWIDRTTMENDPLFVDFFNNWPKNDFIDSWVRERGVQNIAKATDKIFQQHPYKPSYLYASAMAPFTAYPIAGVIWYQGESNANNTELHEKLFPALVQSWRNARGYDFPFYYVQLSSMEVGRESWGRFRDSQRRMIQQIPYCGMAVTSDIGDRIDVHPPRKKEVGERLARWALADTYRMDIVKSGPLFQSADFQGDNVVVYFSETKRLKTSDNRPVATFELAGKDKIYYPAQAIIEGAKVKVKSIHVPNPVFIRYGWSSFSEGNLVNEADLPASTFSTEFEE